MQQTPRPSQPSNKRTSSQAQAQSSSPRTHTRNFRFFATAGSVLVALAATVTILRFFGITDIGSFFHRPTSISAATVTPMPTPTLTPTPAATATSIPTPTGSQIPARYPQLRSSYSGSAHGYQNASLRFTNVTQDPQGNVSLVLVFTLVDNQKQATYSCQGAFTGDQSFTLNCTQVDNPNFQVAITASIVSGGQLQGTLEATDTADTTYDHLYAWNAQGNGS